MWRWSSCGWRTFNGWRTLQSFFVLITHAYFHHLTELKSLFWSFYCLSEFFPNLRSRNFPEKEGISISSEGFYSAFLFCSLNLWNWLFEWFRFILALRDSVLCSALAYFFHRCNQDVRKNNLSQLANDLQSLTFSCSRAKYFYHWMRW